MTAVLVANSNDSATMWSEICRRFPDEWVALVDAAWVDDGAFDFSSARVIGHGKRRADAIAQARQQLGELDGYGCFYTGRVRAPVAGFFAP